MSPEHRRIPDWAQRDRQHDMEWIKDNLHVFWPVAQEAAAKQGRGALVVDTTSQPTGEGHPFGYLAQVDFEPYKDEEINRMIREYDSTQELVLVMLKPDDRMSTYRVKARWRQSQDTPNAAQ